ncbi:MAG: hypothetical protein VW707_07195 [Candidatus Puniceispirillum sp.]
MSAFLKKCAEKSKGYLINWSFRACRECSEVAAVEMTTIQISTKHAGHHRRTQQVNQGHRRALASPDACAYDEELARQC